ncbi:hypothetical protein ACSSS7_006364 [Eimeria intestinalis]
MLTWIQSRASLPVASKERRLGKEGSCLCCLPAMQQRTGLCEVGKQQHEQQQQQEQRLMQQRLVQQDEAQQQT